MSMYQILLKWKIQKKTGNITDYSSRIGYDEEMLQWNGNKSTE